MKKRMVLILTVVLLVSAVCVLALAEEGKGGSWPVVELKGSAAVLNTMESDRDFRQQSFSGPGRGYSLSGAYLPHKLVSLTAVQREGGYVLAEVDYRSGKRYVYFPENVLQPVEAETVSWTPVRAGLKAGNRVYFGPGKQYTLVTRREKSPYADYSMEELMKEFDGDLKKIERALEDVFIPVELGAGARVNALFEADGWVLCEFTCDQIGLARGWIPADQLAAE